MRVYPELTVDGEFKSLGDLGHTGSLNDRQFSFLRAAGYTNGLTDMFSQRSASLSFTPISLFAASEPGVWYDPSDLSTMFQDTAGTVAVTSPGQSVARINDKSGRGNHATQGTAAARPVYGVIPETGQRNLITYSNDFTNTGAWTNGALSVTLNADGLAQKIVPTATGVSYYGRTVAGINVTNGVSYTWSARMKAAGKRYAFLQINVGTSSVAYTFDLQTATVGSTLLLAGPALTNSTAIVLEADGYCRVSVTFTTTATNLNAFGGPCDSTASRNVTLSGTDGIFVRNAQFELGSTATTEQTVVTLAQITEPGVASLGHLFFDGVDDCLITPTITPNTGVAQVFVGTTKLAGGTYPVILEHSVSSLVTNGSFNILSQANGANRYFFGMQTGSSNSERESANTYAVPSTTVISYLMNSGAATGSQQIARVNTVQGTTNAAGNPAAGNFLAHPIYIGRRGGSSLPFNGRYYSIIVRFGPELGTPIVSSAESWVNSKTKAFV